uniref:Major facilitator superfamily (MFS) profile domain-containing protein n=1 Tax=Chromera velia CCMP2878 TaxID=1169474 RepID=A0A0G4HNH3_9ALVE|eukprot:Cvel_7636.t1-p1 / transcript=Cvel_7636.t1 / gene=Cvel_7636 / organism=Chromera_velia_CCMP2878 / gene_product=Glucose-6-phosphate translocase, putative / transcript_product=Glucose-6-phosphate translocase, putative / location=Cvel_scaffold403:66825-71297(+) / protein_length=803 / sequence_SO=supercontig / SO=protein_coding / is_pseudo=false
MAPALRRFDEEDEEEEEALVAVDQWDGPRSGVQKEKEGIRGKSQAGGMISLSGWSRRPDLRRAPSSFGTGSGGKKGGIVVAFRTRTLVLLYVGYAIVMLNRGAIDAANPAMERDRSFNWDFETAGKVFSAGNFAYLIGKLIAGGVVDMVGARAVFSIGLVIVALDNILVAFQQNPEAVGGLWILFRVVLAFVWPALTKLVCVWVPATDYGYVFGVMSTSSRTGNVLSALILGRLLISGFHWRAAFIVSGLLLLGIGVSYHFLIFEDPASALQAAGLHLSASSSLSLDNAGADLDDDGLKELEGGTSKRGRRRLSAGGEQKEGKKGRPVEVQRGTWREGRGGDSGKTSETEATGAVSVSQSTSCNSPSASLSPPFGGIDPEAPLSGSSGGNAFAISSPPPSFPPPITIPPSHLTQSSSQADTSHNGVWGSSDLSPDPLLPPSAVNQQDWWLEGGGGPQGSSMQGGGKLVHRGARLGGVGTAQDRGEVGEGGSLPSSLSWEATKGGGDGDDSSKRKGMGGPVRQIPQDVSYWGALRVMFSDSQFLLVGVSILFLTPVTEMNSWWPSFLSHTLGRSPGEGAVLAAAFPLGFVVSMLAGGKLYDRSSYSGRLMLVTFCLVALTACVLALRVLTDFAAAQTAPDAGSGAVWRLSGVAADVDPARAASFFDEDAEASEDEVGFGGVRVEPADDKHPQVEERLERGPASLGVTMGIVSCVFLIGLFVGPPFYIPTGVYASNFGGVRHCGTMSGMMDAFGYTSTTLFMTMVGHLAALHSWGGLLDILAMSCFLGTMCFGFFMYRNLTLKLC